MIIDCIISITVADKKDFCLVLVVLCYARNSDKPIRLLAADEMPSGENSKDIMREIDFGLQQGLYFLRHSSLYLEKCTLSGTPGALILSKILQKRSMTL